MAKAFLKTAVLLDQFIYR